MEMSVAKEKPIKVAGQTKWTQRMVIVNIISIKADHVFARPSEDFATPDCPISNPKIVWLVKNFYASHPLVSITFFRENVHSQRH